METFELDSLQEKDWERIVEFAHSEADSIMISLQNLKAASPAGAIALILAARSRRQRRLNMRIKPPPEKSRACKHLIRIDFFRLMRWFSIMATVPEQRLEQFGRNQSKHFTEILRVGDFLATKQIEQVETYLLKRFGKRRTPALAMFDEIKNNIFDHTGKVRDKPALNVIQVQEGAKELELAFGDLGVGFLTSLRRNPEMVDVETEEGALVKAIEEMASGLNHKDGNRGGGLRAALDAISKLGGRFCLVSGNGMVSRSGEQEAFLFTTVPYVFPGTIMSVNVPL